ncbi:MAG: metallophosphoesterase [Alphaproteobacteria bacterium]|nr:metallophosphoesterase [Alphaproteobacteria bacterium]
MARIERGPWRNTPKPADTDHFIAAIGDVHGRADLLEPLLEALAEDAIGPGIDRASCIFLGDLIDRGPDVVNALGLAAGGLGMFIGDRLPVEDVLLLGNHDGWLRAALDNRLTADELNLWRTNGGGETWAAFGIAAAQRPDAIVDALRRAVPLFVQDAVRAMVPIHRIGDWMFAHAGLDPRRPLQDQPLGVVSWIRDPFLYPERPWPFPVVVVHGHTPEEPFEEPTIMRHRINLDTGAFFTGVLTALELRNDQMRFVQAKG